MLRIFLDRLGEQFPLINRLVENSDILRPFRVMGSRKGSLRTFFIVDFHDASNWAAIIVSIALFAFAFWMFNR